MTHTIYKVFWAWEHEKEEAWLNEMSAKGMHLEGVSFCRYVFREGEPGEYTYRLELLDNMPSHPMSRSYIRFLEEAGVEQFGSYFRWIYLRKKSSDGDFDIYSDIDSKLRHYKRIRVLIFAVTMINIPSFCLNLANYIASKNSFLPWLVFTSGLLISLLSYGLLKIQKKISWLKREKKIRE